jgi:hypothetical protein
MPYLQSHCDFCGEYVGEGGKRTRTNALCAVHLNKTNAIPKKAGKKVLNHSGHVASVPSFGGPQGYKRPIHGSGF